jgi:hypothetical protein
MFIDDFLMALQSLSDGIVSWLLTLIIKFPVNAPVERANTLAETESINCDSRLYVVIILQFITEAHPHNNQINS